MHAMHTTSSSRRFDLDWLRILAFSLLILYHVGVYYGPGDWHIKSVHASATIEPLLFLTSPWRLSLLFVVSGAVTWLLLRKQSVGEFARERSSRLVLPLLFAVVVVVPPQAYLEVVQKGGYTLGYFEFRGRYLQADPTFCKDGSCLRVPTWNHMWFIAYLWVYVMILALLYRIAPQAIRAIPAWGAHALRGWRILVVPIVYLAIIRFLMVTRFPTTHDLINDWFNHVTYLSMFLFGVFFVGLDSVRADIARLRWVSLALALASYVPLAGYYAYYANTSPPDALRYVQRVVWAINQWCAIMAAFGFAQVLLNRDGPARRYLNAAILPLYLFHQTAIILIAWWLIPLTLTPLFEAALIVLLTVLSSVLLYEVTRRVPILSSLVGARRNPPIEERAR